MRRKKNSAVVDDLMHPCGTQTDRCSDGADGRSLFVCGSNHVVSFPQRRSRLFGGSAYLAKVWRGHETFASPSFRLSVKRVSTWFQVSVPSSQSAIARFTFGVGNSRANSRTEFSEADMSAPFVVGVEEEFTSRNIDAMGIPVKCSRQALHSGLEPICEESDEDAG